MKFYIGDVRNYNSVEVACRGVDYIFNAAALKQVPSCEFFPLEATETNVFGIANVIRAGVNNNVERIICLSTDKAAYPINAMGISKALMEKVAIAESSRISQSKTKIAITRYGNVMGSRGSVIPHFINQIVKGEDITITEPSMTRFLMSLDEAVDLVEFAFENVDQGDLFIQKAPACTVETLAIALRELFAVENEIKIIGMRHGEKMHETLATAEELMKSSDMGNYYRIPADNRDLNYEKYFSEGRDTPDAIKPYTSAVTRILSTNEVKDKLLQMPFINESLTSFRNA